MASNVAKAPAPSTDEIQRLLEENFVYIKAVVDQQNMGRTQEVNQYLQRLQANLMLLAAVADNQPTPAASAIPAALPMANMASVARPALITTQPQRFPGAQPPQQQLTHTQQQAQLQQQLQHQHQLLQQQLQLQSAGVGPGVLPGQGLQPLAMPGAPGNMFMNMQPQQQQQQQQQQPPAAAGGAVGAFPTQQQPMQTPPPPGHFGTPAVGGAYG